MYLIGDGDRQGLFAVEGGKRPNLSPAFLKVISAALKLPQKGAHGLPDGVTPEEIFHYAYGVFHSPGYRSRYAEFLKIDFPRLPLTGNLELFRALARLGGELTALHLLESPKLEKSITQFIGGKNPVVKKFHGQPTPSGWTSGRRPPASKACPKPCGISTSAAIRFATNG